MPIETATYIHELNSSNPPSSDAVAQADDHIRLVKGAVKATFPSITGAVTANQAALNNPILQVTPTANRIPWYNGSNNADLLPVTAIGQALLNAADSAAVRTQAGITTTAYTLTLLDDADAAAARATLGATSVGAAVFTAADQAAAQSALGITAAIPPPTGGIIMWGSSTPPAGWLECNGAAVSRTTYAALFAIIQTTFGSGDNVNTFNLPDLRGEFIRGWDNGRSVDSGRALGSTQAEALKAHTHDHTAKQTTTAGGAATFNAWAGGSAVGSNVTVTTGAVTGGAGTETRPRNVALMYIIKT